MSHCPATRRAPNSTTATARSLHRTYVVSGFSRTWHSLVPMVFDLFPLGNRLVAQHFLVGLARPAERGLSGALRAHREHRQQALQFRAMTIFTGGGFGCANQRFELVAALQAAVFVQGHYF